MRVNPLVELSESGQAIWYDGIERGLLTSGELKLLIDEDQLRGVTANPTIFEKAIDSSGDYSDQLQEDKKMAVEWNKEADAALAEAKTSKRPLLIDFSAAPA